VSDTFDFDVFLSYHWRDHAQVEVLAKRLRQAGVRRITRYLARTRWWDGTLKTCREAALVPPEDRAQLPDLAVPEQTRVGYAGDKPVFVGHYWMTGRPEVLSPMTACVDYSAGKGGPLVAYRWSGEPALSSGNFVASE
jgi:hypothetical protein